MISITQSFVSSEDVGILIRNALMMLVTSLKVSRAALARFNEEKGIIAFEYEWGSPEQKIKPMPREGTKFAPGEIFYDTFITQGDVHVACNNIEEHPRLAKFLSPLGVKSCIFVPITVYNNFWGILGIERNSVTRDWEDSDIQLLKLVAGTMASLIIRAEAEAELISAKEQAEQARKQAELSSMSKTNFLARMSHEMRTPMNAIIGMSTIAQSSKDPEKMEYCMSKINEASVHLLGVINDILDMSKIEAGKFELSNSEFDFERMLKKNIGIMEFKFNEKRQNLIVRVEPDVPSWIIADEQRIGQVLTNLLSNAVKFSNVDADITLTVKVKEKQDRFCTLRFDVIDTGIGISPEQKNRLFNIFEQADGSVARKYGGTGLGLAISKSIVELMGGEIWVESEPKKGSDFAFEITVEEGKSRQGNAYKGTISRANLRILVVDDSWEVLEYFKEYALQTKIDCVTASGGEEAFEFMEAAEEVPFDMVFVDWRMPVMNGIELTEKIKARFGQKVVVIMISASEWDAIEKDAKGAGVDGFIPKPLFPSVLTDTINKFLVELEQGESIGQQGAGFEGKTILLAEDVEINREIVVSLLEDTGIIIESAENGAQALAMFSADPAKYSLILMDIHMPEMDGYEATRRIRALPGKGAKVPIVAMTANVFQEDIKKCRDVGMNDHLGKPIDVDSFMKMLEKYLIGNTEKARLH